MSSLATPSGWQTAWQSGNPVVRGFYANEAGDWHPGLRSPGSWKPLDPAEIAEWKGWLASHGVDAAQMGGVDALADASALAVITGQQAGAGLGPLYSLFKALAARRWADEVAAETGRPVVTLFWVASDDHDLEEVRRAVWQGSDGQLVEADLAAPDQVGDRSVWRQPLDRAATEALMAQLQASTPPTEFRPAVIEALQQAFAPGATFESQFVSLAVRWLLPLGIIPIVPRLGFMRRRALPILRRELLSHAETSALVRSQGDALRGLGGEPLLHRKGSEVNYFLDCDGIRAALSVGESGVIEARSPVDKSRILGRWAPAELMALAESEPERFSPNAILRPLVQDLALPTVAYVGGPGEILYHAQLGPLYGAFGVHRAALLPRPNLHLLDTKTLKAMGKLGLSVESLGTGADPTVGLEQAVDDPLLAAYQERVAGLQAHVAELKSFLAGAVPDQSVERSHEKLAGAVETGLSKLGERVTLAIAARDEDRHRSIAKVRGALFPHGQPQERVVGAIAPLLVNYGPGILAQLLEVLPLRSNGFAAVNLAELASQRKAAP